MKRFTLGSSSIGDLEKQYVQKVLDDNYISPGPVVEHVQNVCAQLHGMKHGLALNSGQSALHVAIQALVETRLNQDDRKPIVAVPACTYISTLAAAILAGCDIVLVDVDLYCPSANMSASHLSTVLQDQKESGDPVDIVIPVHLFGKACNPEVFDVCEEFGVWVVEDACESTFAPNMGRGHILTTSFFSNHLISAGGGGVIMTNDDELDLYCWKLINHGRSGRFGNDDIHKIAEKFHFDVWGHSMKWSDVPAAIAKAQIERRDELYKARIVNANVLMTALNKWELEDRIILPDPKGHTFMVYPIILDERLDANNVIHYLNTHGIEVRRLMPITNQPIVQKYFNSRLEDEFPVAHLINRQGFYVGVHPELSTDDMEEMSSMIDEAIKQEANRMNL
jgi:dTDP-4-amino-4,6-dideoxygalactose transaminase